MGATTQGDTATFSSVLRVGEFRAMWLAELLSFLGDQLARVALSVLVYNRTSSAALTGLTYALTYLPTVLGALTLSAIADRRPRREFMVVIDLVRTAVVVLMVLPGVPLWALCALVATEAFAAGPYRAAHLAILRDILTAEQYPVGMTIRQVTTQFAQLLGFALGGTLSAAISPRFCLAVNAVTYLAAAACTRFGLRRRPAPPGAQTSGGSAFAQLVQGAGVVWADKRRRAIFLLTLLAVGFVVPQGIAAPYAAQLGAGDAYVGYLMASTAVGSIVALFTVSKLLTRERRRRSIAWLSVAGGVPLLGCFFAPGLVPSMIIFAVGNALWILQIAQASTAMVELLPDDKRAQGMGICSSMNMTAQGVGTGLAGVLASATNARVSIGVAGAVACLFAVWPTILWLRTTRPAFGRVA